LKVSSSTFPSSAPAKALQQHGDDLDNYDVVVEQSGRRRHHYRKQTTTTAMATVIVESFP
jgi:hypothetical protein